MATVGRGTTRTIRHSKKRSTFLLERQAFNELAFVIATITLFGAVTAIGAMLLLLALTS